MGRRKVQMQRIENTTNRQVTFSKRKAGLFKKANELSILCVADVAVIVYSNTGKFFDFSSSSMKEILEKYKTVSGAPLWDTQYENMMRQLGRARKENEELKNQLRRKMGEDLGSVQPKELASLEQTLDRAVKIVRKRKGERLQYEYSSYKRKLEWASSLLGLQNPQFEQVANYNGCMFCEQGEGSNGAGTGEGHMEKPPSPSSTPPSVFRVQPTQPNLQNCRY